MSGQSSFLNLKKDLCCDIVSAYDLLDIGFFNPARELWANVIFKAYTDLYYYPKYLRDCAHIDVLLEYYEAAKSARQFIFDDKKISEEENQGYFVWLCEMVAPNMHLRLVDTIRTNCKDIQIIPPTSGIRVSYINGKPHPRKVLLNEDTTNLTIKPGTIKPDTETTT